MAGLLILVLALPLAGCGGTADQNATVAQGAGAGAILGGIVGAIIGGRDGALLGAAIGGVGGAAVGVHVASQKAKFASQEDYLDACIASAHKTNQQTVQYNSSLASDIRKLDQQTATLRQQYDQRRVSKNTMVQRRKVVQAKLKEAKQQLAHINKEIQIQQQVLNNEKGKAPAHLSKLNQELAQLRATAAQLERQTSQLAAIDNRMNV
jgi:chromosome segregation ATPase